MFIAFKLLFLHSDARTNQKVFSLFSVCLHYLKHSLKLFSIFCNSLVFGILYSILANMIHPFFEHN